MRGRVRIDGELWCEGTTANPQHTLGAMLAYASAGEKLDAGDVISTGTMPGCCWPRARPLDPAGTDSRARDRRDRHASPTGSARPRCPCDGRLRRAHLRPRPGGPAAALLLDDLGVSVIAFDKASEPYDLPRAAVVDDEVMRIFQAAGVD